MNELNKNRVKIAGFILAGALAAFVIVYADVILRARHSYFEAERYVRWHQNPKLKQEYFDHQFDLKKAGLEKNLNAGKITRQKFDEELEAAQFDRDFRMQESSLKYAYQWYKDTYELFSPPESRWVKLAREKAPQTLAVWKEELREKKIPFTDTMLE